MLEYLQESISLVECKFLSSEIVQEVETREVAAGFKKKIELSKY